MLNRLWFSFFLIPFVIASYHLLLLQDGALMTAMMKSMFDMSKIAFEVALGLIGVLALWMGFMKIAERAGVVEWLGKKLSPLFTRLMPDVPEGHPAFGSITMTLAANMLGLDNAATPIGLKAMEHLQTLNPKKDTATNAQILFLVINTSSVMLLPLTIFMFRIQYNSVDPTSVFVPIILATTASTLAGITCVAWVQRLHLLNRVVMGYLFGIIAAVAGLVWWISSTPLEARAVLSATIANTVLVTVVMVILMMGFWKKVPVYEAFIDGAKEGFDVAVRLIPYLVAMLVAIGVFRASGALQLLLDGMTWIVELFNGDTAFVEALPTAFMKPFSGSAARAMMIDAMQTHGVDSLVARMTAVIQGSTETTFYVIAVYYGAVGIKRIRHTVWCGLIADVVGISTAIGVSYWFFGS